MRLRGLIDTSVLLKYEPVTHTAPCSFTLSVRECVCVCVVQVSEVCVCGRERERETLNISEVCVSALFSVTKGPASGVQ